MRRAALVGALALVLVACDSAAKTTTTTLPLPVATTTTTTSTPPSTSTTQAAATTTSTTSPSTTTESPNPPTLVTIFMLHDSGGSPTRIGPFLAPVGRNENSLEATIQAVLSGLSPSEIDLGITTAVPEGTELNAVDVFGGIATVDLTSRFASGGGTFSMGARLAQLVYTVTGYDPSITGVRLQLDGVPVEVFSSEGIVLDDPMTRASYADLLPGILIESPPFDAWVRPPLTITGIAAAFEGVFQLEILDGDRNLVTDVPFVQTDNGMGWANFSVTFEASELPPMPVSRMWIRVYEASAQDGRVISERFQPFGYRENP